MRRCPPHRALPRADRPLRISFAGGNITAWFFYTLGKRMRAIAIILAVGLLLVGCAETARPIFLCPQACKTFVGDWTSLRECLFKQDGGYWLTDSSGRALESYRYRHESGVLPITTTRQKQDHISTPILLKRNTTGAVLHLIYGGVEQSISIDDTKREEHTKYDVLFVL